MPSSVPFSLPPSTVVSSYCLLYRLVLYCPPHLPLHLSSTVPFPLPFPAAIHYPIPSPTHAADRAANHAKDPSPLTFCPCSCCVIFDYTASMFRVGSTWILYPLLLKQSRKIFLSGAWRTVHRSPLYVMFATPLSFQNIARAIHDSLRCQPDCPSQITVPIH